MTVSTYMTLVRMRPIASLVYIGHTRLTPLPRYSQLKGVSAPSLTCSVLTVTNHRLTALTDGQTARVRTHVLPLPLLTEAVSGGRSAALVQHFAAPQKSP